VRPECESCTFAWPAASRFTWKTNLSTKNGFTLCSHLKSAPTKDRDSPKQVTLKFFSGKSGTWQEI